jgi:N-dimethylarginine dimethylaminohydrolase
MCAPDHYGVEYEINPWMKRDQPADTERAAAQWQALRDLLAGELGAEVLLVPQQDGLPDMVFTANAGLVWGRRVIVASFHHAERQGESVPFGEWFASRGFETTRLSVGRCFEGEGDALFVGETLFCGYHFRSDVGGHREVGELLGVRALSLQLTDPHFYHLDTCFCPLAPDLVAWYPAAFDEYAVRVVRANVPRLIEVCDAEARRFACNAVVIGRRVALNIECPSFEASLREAGFEPFATPLDEFLKAGGSAKCLTLYLDPPPSLDPMLAAQLSPQEPTP